MQLQLKSQGIKNSEQNRQKLDNIKQALHGKPESDASE